MEYILLLEKKRRFWILGLGLALYLIFIAFSFMVFNFYGIVFSLGLLFFIIFTPMLLGKYKFFLFLWILLLPLVNNFEKELTFGSINLLTFFVTGLSFPFAVILIFDKFETVIKKIPFIGYLIIFEILLLLNVFRVDSPMIPSVQAFRFHFIELFLIFSTYFYLKKNPPQQIFNWINIYVVINALTAIFQRLTGMGLVYIEGFARVQGLTGHPNALGFLLNIYLPLGMYMFYKADTKKSKIIWGSSAIISMIALILTLSKTSYLIFGLTLLVIFMNLSAKYKVHTFLYSILGVFILAIVDFLAGLNLFQNIIQRFSNTSSLAWRFGVWQSLIDNINFASFIGGHGINSVQQYLMQINPGSVASSHNGYLQLLYEYGILGLTYIFSIIAVFISAIKKGFIKNDINTRCCQLILITVSMVLLVEMFVDQAIVTRTILYYAWIVLTIFYLKLFNNESYKA